MLQRTLPAGFIAPCHCRGFVQPRSLIATTTKDIPLRLRSDREQNGDDLRRDPIEVRKATLN
jgi:hypothetical protein